VNEPDFCDKLNNAIAGASSSFVRQPAPLSNIARRQHRRAAPSPYSRKNNTKRCLLNQLPQATAPLTNIGQCGTDTGLRRAPGRQGAREDRTHTDKAEPEHDGEWGNDQW
jgi:hypothetical protein